MNFLERRNGSVRFVPVIPQLNKAWMDLCEDPRWNYQKPEEEEIDNKPLYYCKDWDLKEGISDEMSREHKPVAAPNPSTETDDNDDENIKIHAGALAPKFVFEKDVEPEPVNDGHDIYMKRLICVLCNRFVILSRPQEPQSLQESGGIPMIGSRYWWRYWDNDQNVYEVRFEQFRDAAGTCTMSLITDTPSVGVVGVDVDVDEVQSIRTSRRSNKTKILYRNLEAVTMVHGMPPGEFVSLAMKDYDNNNLPMWMRVKADLPESWSELTDLASFFDHMWSFRHHGTTRVALWDANLMILANSAGLPPTKACRACGNSVEQALRRCTRCKLVYYCRDGKCQQEDWKDHKKMCNYFK